MTEIIELKDFLMEEQYNINQHFTDLSSRIDMGKYKEVTTLREDCASKNYVTEILVVKAYKFFL